jgi:hypothetical protein
MYDESIGGIKTALDSYKKSIGATEDGLSLTAKTFFKFQEAVAPAIGSAGILNKAVTSVTTELSTLGSAIPVIGAKFTQAGDIIKNYLQTITGTPLNDMTIGTVTNLTVGGTQTPDGVIMNDGFVQFNPRDKFTKVNDGMTVAGTNVGGIDRFAAQMEKRDSRFEATMTRLLSNMAAQMKQGIESANLKINVDRTFSSNSMNKGRYA